MRYQFVVPPLPNSYSWDCRRQTFYIWGDVDFDPYESAGRYPLSRYATNQIVPQLMIGNSLAKNGPGYVPIGVAYKDRVIEAQYFWKRRGASYAQAGGVVHVKPGEMVMTVIRYSAADGKIFAGISAPSGTSEIVIPRPFPNEPRPLFSSWRDFFEQAAARSSRLMARPLINVETHYVDEDTLCSVLPFGVESMSLPGVPAESAAYRITQQGNFVCPGPLAKLNF